MSSDTSQNPATPDAPPSVGDSAFPTRPPHPSTLGDYELKREIGRGGMGTVYEAWQRSLQRRVALKVLGSQVASSANAVMRFRREAQAAAKLSHTHIIPIYAQGEEDGIYYYAMEFIDGDGLNKIISELRTGHPVGDSTTTINDPEATIALTPAEDVVSSTADTIAIAKPGGARTSLSDSGVILSTIPASAASAEHFRMLARQIAAVADALDYAHKRGVIHRDIKPHNLIFSRDGRLMISDFGLARIAEQPGVTATGEMLGSPLYMSAEQISKGPSQVDHRTDVYSLGATMYEWLALSPPFPGETRERVINLILNSEPVRPRLHNPAMPVELETICLKALERDRDKRYQSAEQMRDDLIRFGLGEPIRARRPGMIRRSRKLIGRHQVASVALAAVVMAVALTAALVVSRREVQTQTTDAQVAKQQTDKILDYVSTLDFLGRTSAEAAVIDITADAVGPVVQDLLQTGQQLRLSGEGAATRGPDAAAAATAQGIALGSTGDLLSAIVADQRTGSAAHPNVLGGDDLILQMEQSLIEQADATTNCQHKHDLLAQALAMNPANVLCRQKILQLCCQEGLYEEMLEQTEQLMQFDARSEFPFLWQGLARLPLGQADIALEDFSQAVQINGLSQWARGYRGLALILANRPEEAILEFNNALSLDPGLTFALLGRAAAFAKMEQTRSAIEDLTRVLSAQPANADALAARGEHYAALHEYKEAARDFDEAMSIAGKSPALVVQYLIAVSLQRGADQAQETREPSGEQAKTKLETTEGGDRSSELDSPSLFERLFGRPAPKSDKPGGRRGAPGYHRV